ncbi:hypothetical protein EMQ25_05375 [Arsenicitalea aurantiaca]|uniref:Beta-glucosidase n=1 Tax=Arsenicitalea aurantiaca TaxID=1783274 RepID=A0A433XEV2_9HYPH|nr:GH116 family glycosyl-hydrolase [Arsenicitalea aurantiaca]RUT32586.1 hypothetical protein EMQ25_05375 [Arsenicitalea aurantiaca]
MPRVEAGIETALEQPPHIYEGERTAAISFPLGGIGTGSIGLSGAGRLVDWEIFNRPAKGSLNALSHFAVRAEAEGRVLDARMLNGPYRDSAMGSLVGEAYRSFGFGARRGSLVGMPHFARCGFDGRFPVAGLDFSDPHFPGSVGMTAFNPFIPSNERDSGLPAAMFEVRFTNPLHMPVTYSLVAVLGHDMPGQPMAQLVEAPGFRGIMVHDGDTPGDDPEFAQLLVATDADQTSRQSYLYRGLWYDALEVYWNDLNRPGPFSERVYPTRDDRGGMIRDRDGSLQAAHLTLAPGETGTLRMLLAWYVPNFQKYWVSPVWHFTEPSMASGRWKNWYATEWSGVEEVATEAFARWGDLRAQTIAFRDALYGSTLPWPFLDAAGANLSTLKSPTVLRLEDGTLYGWEGCHPKAGSCEGTCTHVWNYQQAFAYLFPRLSRTIRDADYAYNIDEKGEMSFRLGVPLGTRLKTERACADGQFGNVMLVYRDWKLCGDSEWLARLWPAIRRSIEYAWSPDNADQWDPDRTGILHGRQHHTLDMELFGPNAWLSGYYVGALAAAAEMGEALGDAEFATLCRSLADAGREHIDRYLFNGSHFIHQIDLSDKSILQPYRQAERSRRLLGAGIENLYWSAEHNQIKYQLGEACFIDQLASQWHAGLYGLQPIFARDKAISALRAIRANNYVDALGRIANSGRVFGYGEEAGTIAVAWADSVPRPLLNIPYAQETLHGMEYALGTTLLQYGLVEDAIATFKAVRDRYDGTLRNPWSEMECGSNYARSMASWGIVPAASGFHVDAPRGEIGFSPRIAMGGRFRSVWSLDEAWGEVEFENGACTLRVMHGALTLSALRLTLGGGAGIVRRNGEGVPARFEIGRVAFGPITLGAGDRLEIKADDLTLEDATDLETRA